MGGMCLGSLLFTRVISARRHPLRVYAALELGIGGFGLLVLWAIPLVDRLYAAVAVHGLSGVLPRAVAAAVCLIPPTLLMGASLPAVARWVKSDSDGVRWLGWLYGANIAGAIVGSLAAGFYLLRVYDMPTATYAAVAINLAIALISLLAARRTPYFPPNEAATESAASKLPGRGPVTSLFIVPLRFPECPHSEPRSSGRAFFR